VLVLGFLLVWGLKKKPRGVFSVPKCDVWVVEHKGRNSSIKPHPFMCVWFGNFLAAVLLECENM